MTILLSGKDLILATKDFAVDTPWRSWWSIGSTFFLLALSIAGTIWSPHILLQGFCSVLTGLLILRSFVIYHDHQHASILPHSKFAEFMMRVYGILTLNPSSVWKSSHNYHHKHNSKLRSAHIGSFPIMTKEKFLNSTPAQQRRYLFIRHPLTILFGYIFTFLYGMCLQPFMMYPRKHFDCLLAIVVHVSIGVFLMMQFGVGTLFLTLIIPCFLAYAMGSYLFYAQHNFPGVIFSDHAGWTYEKAAMQSSSYLKTGKLMAWFSGNIGYHHIHHLNAKVPFYRLPDLMKKVPELQNPVTTTLSPVDIYRCLRLKVWDVEAQQMVGL
ncbi:MAG: fatty acid desaturase [Bdellovibrionota bacterium]